jgi:hypothetical protein
MLIRSESAQGVERGRRDLVEFGSQIRQPRNLQRRVR